jgi:hypothetical protein
VLIGAPELHHWHHDRDREAGNYANIRPSWIGCSARTAVRIHEPEHFGIHEPIPRSYLGQMIHPFLPRRRTSANATSGCGARSDDSDIDKLRRRLQSQVDQEKSQPAAAVDVQRPHESAHDPRVKGDDALSHMRRFLSGRSVNW